MRSPCSLGRVPTSVTTSSASCARPPAIIEDLHTIADLRDPDQIRRDSDAGATRWPRGGGQGWVDSTPRVRERSHEAGARTDICSGRPPAEGPFLSGASSCGRRVGCRPWLGHHRGSPPCSRHSVSSRRRATPAQASGVLYRRLGTAEAGPGGGRLTRATLTDWLVRHVSSAIPSPLFTAVARAAGVWRPSRVDIPS